METKNKKKIFCITVMLLIAVYVLIYQCFLLKKYLKYSDTLTAASLMLVTFSCILYLGYHKDKSTYLKKEVLKIVIFQVVLYFTVIYALGFAFGFLRNAYSLKIAAIVDNILAPIFIVVVSEILRYVIISHNKENKDTISKIIIVLVTIVLALVDISTQMNIRMFTSVARTFNLITSIIIPSIAKNIVLSYLTYNVGYKPSLIYRIVMDLYVYLVPIFPDLSEYVSSMLGILLPFLIYLYTSRVIEYEEKEKEEKVRTNIVGVSDISLICIATILICLISGKFSYYLLGVATGSMEPKIRIGDAVLVHKIRQNEEINVGDVVVYENDGKKIIHRVVTKDEDIDGNIYYVTKGDANGSDDGMDIYIEEIEGKVLINIPYIGMPSVWASEILE